MRKNCFKNNLDKIITDMELFAQLSTKPIIGVTGSNGKSTVVSLIDKVFKDANKNFILCGNIGLPVLQTLIDFDDKVDGYIIELSSYHLEKSPSLNLEVGLLLNISPDHLDRYKDFDDYAQTKMQVIKQANYKIVNFDDSWITNYLKDNNIKCVGFSRTKQQKEPNLYTNKNLIKLNNNSLFDMNNYKQIGLHHCDNVMAVFLVANYFNIDKNIIAKSCANFNGLAHRCVKVLVKNGITFINDSKGTNVGATIAAVNGINQPIILIAGGQAKEQDFAPLLEVAKGKIKALILIGIDAKKIAKYFDGIIDYYFCDSLEKAFDKSVELAKPNDVVMLSPACASFDMFESYIVRGNEFEKLVSSLKI